MTEQPCPNCGELIGQWQEYCPECGVGLLVGSPTHESRVVEAWSVDPILEECPECGATTQKRRSFCPRCGVGLVNPDAVAGKCLSCGTQMAWGTPVCPSCGKKLTWPEDRQESPASLQLRVAPKDEPSEATGSEALEPRRPSEVLRPPLVGTADELSRLADLVDRGVLTKEEFALQKKRLLSASVSATSAAQQSHGEATEGEEPRAVEDDVPVDDVPKVGNCLNCGTEMAWGTPVCPGCGKKLTWYTNRQQMPGSMQLQVAQGRLASGKRLRAQDRLALAADAKSQGRKVSKTQVVADTGLVLYKAFWSFVFLVIFLVVIGVIIYAVATS